MGNQIIAKINELLKDTVDLVGERDHSQDKGGDVLNKARGNALSAAELLVELQKERRNELSIAIRLLASALHEVKWRDRKIDAAIVILEELRK